MATRANDGRPHATAQVLAAPSINALDGQSVPVSRAASRKSLSPTKHSTPSRNLSPSKSKSHGRLSTVARSPTRSPRRSPAKSPFRSVQSVSFTPQRTNQPRAWERKPATPFVPRDDKQKIWKRVPLGELGVDINRPSGVSRREQGSRKDYIRVLKKLKVGHDVDEDKENVVSVVTGKENDDTAEGKGSVSVMIRHNFVSMRMEEDLISGSPRKKLRQHAAQGTLEDDTDGHTDDSVGQQEIKTDDILDFEEQILQPESHGEDELSSDDDADWDKGLDGTLAESPNNQAGNTQGHATVAEVQVTTDNGLYMAPDEDEGEALSLEPACGGQKPDMTTALDEGTLQETYSHVDEAAQEDPQVATPTGRETEGLQSSLADPMEVAPSVLAGDAAEDASTSDDSAEDHEQAVLEQNRSSSPPTILGGYVVVDELAAKQSPRVDGLQAIAKPSSTQNEAQQESEVPCASAVAPRRISDDEAAFLRDFMSRSKALKAAREQALQPNAQEEAMSKEEPNHITSAEVDTGAIDANSTTLNLEPPRPAKQETASRSPLRRSKRAAVTSIPRPQPAPNSIQLKRATGNEFIFTANKPASTANVALTTRTNTKKNRGSALSVHARLEQLLFERIKEEDDQVDQEANNIDKKGSKKQRREKNGENAEPKVKKVLRWNDENLVSYQEARSAPTDEWEDIEDNSHDDPAHADDASKHVKLTLTLSAVLPRTSQELLDGEDVTQESKPGEQKQAEKNATAMSPQRKVRRVRRGVVGSVNGTPAPKTRSKRLLDVSGHTMNLHAEDEPMPDISPAGSVAIGTLKGDTQEEHTTSANANTSAPSGIRKSRIAVPLAVATVNGATASANARMAVPTRAAVTKDEDKANRGARKSTEQENGTGDRMGRRRLRVRS